MLGTQQVQQYFSSGSSHYILPKVSFEWNYNLFYAPYATFNNPTSTLSSSQFLTPSSWTSQPTIVPKGRITSVFLPDNGLTTRSCLGFATINGAGSSTINVTLPSSNNTYKITFFAKLDTDAVVNLSALAFVDYHRANSSSQRIDNVQWVKFEVYVSSRPVDTPYSSFSLTLDHSAVDSTQSYTVLVDQVEMHQTTDFEYQYGNLWKTSSPFEIFRPGESYVPSGSSLTPLPTDFRKIRQNFPVPDDQTTPSKWDGQVMPVSPVTFHPTLMGTSSFNPAYKNGSLSEWTKYKYFVTDYDDPANPHYQSLTGIYDHTLNTNKIVLKFNLAYSKPATATVVLTNSTNKTTGTTNAYTNTTVSTINITASDISDSGVCVLYLQANGTWSTTKWSSMPQFDFNGNIKFGGNGGAVATVQINQISVTQETATLKLSSPQTNVTTADEIYTKKVNGVVSQNTIKGSTHDASSQMERMQIVEISPRLEVDVSYFTMSVDTKAQLDNQQSPLPISAISSNMATITLSNVPLLQSSSVLSLFSNNSTSSILAGMFRNYVKVYINYHIQDTISGASPSDQVVPGGVFYVDTWDVQDIEKTQVTAYDITKYLQLLQPTDYVSQTEDVYRVISNILDFAGFTDYDFDSLKAVTKSSVVIDGKIVINSAPVKIGYFYCDGTQQKVFDVLREIFLAYQIGAYIDHFGVMKFLSIDAIFDPSRTPSLVVHDTPGSTPINVTKNGNTYTLNVAPNIVTDTYTESTKSKVGKVTMTYKTPQVSKSIAYNSSLSDGKLYQEDGTATYLESSNVIWDSTVDEATTFNHLAESMTPSQAFFKVPTEEATAATGSTNFDAYGIDHDGFGIIEGEIVSFRDKEWSFSFVDASGNATTSYKPQIKVVSNASDLAAAYAEIQNYSGINLGIKPSPTGRIVNVQRGLFNTPVRSHLLLDSSTISQKLYIPTGVKASITSPTPAPVVNVSPTLTAADLAGFINNSTNTPSNPTSLLPGGNIIITSPISTSSHISAKDPYCGWNETASFFDSINITARTFKTDYKTFSTKIRIGQNSGAVIAYGTRAGLLLHDDTQRPSVKIGISKESVGGKDVYRLYVSDPNTNKTLLANNSPYQDITTIMVSDLAAFPTDSPFADYAKYVNLKFVKTSETAFQVYINKHSAFVVSDPGITSLNTSGQVSIFVDAPASSSAAIEFTEIYATQSALDMADIFYHFQTTGFAEKLSSNKKIFEINYLVQSRPEIVGVNFYDVKNAQAPSMDAFPLKIKYDWYYRNNANLQKSGAQSIPDAMTVNENSLAYSPIYHSGFRSRFAIVNCSPSMVWLKKSPDSINTINVDFSLVTNTLITLGNDVYIEKIFDPANVTESVDITTSWVQDKNTASSILRVIYRALDGFVRDTTLSVYGNPLFEIGDIIVLKYALKNILGTYVVQGVEQSFSTGLTTILTLNQISGSINSNSNFVTPSAPPAVSATPTQTGYLQPTSTGVGTNGLAAPTNVYYDAKANILYWLAPAGTQVLFTIDGVDFGFAVTQTAEANNTFALGTLTAGSGNHTIKLQPRASDLTLGDYAIYTIVR